MTPGDTQLTSVHTHFMLTPDRHSVSETSEASGLVHLSEIDPFNRTLIDRAWA